MPRYYVIPYAEPNLHVPVKAYLNPYNGRSAYASGMPQFFGGKADSGEDREAVLKRELSEESRGSMTLHRFDQLVEVYAADEYRFYYTGGATWGSSAWGSAWNSAGAEMDRIIPVNVFEFDMNMTGDQVIQKLIEKVGSKNAPRQGHADFSTSHTRGAFIELVRRFL